MTDFLLITNASAGTNEQDAVEAAVAVLGAQSEVEVAETSKPEELVEVLGHLGDRSVVVAGGDGSLHAVVNVMKRLELLDCARLGLIPLGTGNDFARGVGIPLDPEAAARVIVAGETTGTDLIIDDTGLVVVNNVHLGVGAQASRDASKWKSRLGRLGYLVGAISAGLKPDFIRVKVTVDGRTVMPGGNVAQVAIGNGSTVGGGTTLIPDADPSDGKLNVVLSRTVGPFNRLVYAARLRGGSHTLMKEVNRVSGTEVTVEGDEFWITADGELSGPQTRRTWTLEVGVLEMYLPVLSQVHPD